jgi:hypothetical protein
MMIPITVEEIIRCLLSFFFYIVWPGLVITLFAYRREHVQIPEFFALAIGWSLGLNILLSYAVHFLSGSLAYYSMSVIGFDIVGTSVLLIFFPNRVRDFRKSVSFTFVLIPVLLIALLWFGVIVQNGPRIDYLGDQWFHIAQVRETLESQQIIPNNPFEADAPLSETYGVWHTILAAVAHTAWVDVLSLWRIGNACLGAISFVVIYAVGTMILEHRLASLVAAVVFLASSEVVHMTRTAVYPWGISTLCLWMGLGLFFRYLKSGSRRAGLSAAVIGCVPIFIHPQEFIFFCFGVFALGLSALFLRMTSIDLCLKTRDILIFFLVLLLLGAPVLLIKYPGKVSLNLGSALAMGDQDTDSRPYPHPLATWLAAAFPYGKKVSSLLRTLRSFNLVSLVLLGFLPKNLDRRVRWFLITLTLGPILCVLVPGFSWVTNRVLSELYAWRLLHLIPTPFIWALVMVEGISIREILSRKTEAKHDKIFKYKKWVCLILAFGMIVRVAFSIAIIISRDESPPSHQIVTPLQTLPLFEKIEEFSAKPAIVLSDPWMSYVIPGLTKHQIVVNPLSHGSREDITTRIIASQEFFTSLYQPAEDAVATLRRYDVDLILVNKAWVNRALLEETTFWGIPFYTEYTLEFLGANPTCFQTIYSDATFELFEVVGCDPKEIVNKGEPRDDVVSSQDIAHRMDEQFSGQLNLLGFALPDGDAVLAGHDLLVDLYWQSTPESKDVYVVTLELLCDYPGDELLYGKLLRKVRKKPEDKILVTSQTVWDVMPPAGLGVGDVYVQSVDVAVPENMTQGSCAMNVYAVNSERYFQGRSILATSLMEREYILPGVRLTQITVTDEE